MKDHLDKYDFLMAAVTGIGAGLLDAFGVKKPGEGILGQWTDGKVDDAVKWLASKKGWSPRADQENNVRSAIGFLERETPVNYDQATTLGNNGTGGLVDHMSPRNHHLKSLAHSPDLVGLTVSVISQFTNTSTFLSNGRLITIDTENFELEGGNFPAKVFAGCSNWFWHLASDVAGSSGSMDRGSGIPIPFYNLFLLCDFGQIGQYRHTYAQLMTQIFEGGYDLRHGIAMAIPLLVGELTLALCWSFKRKFYHHWDWKECIPSSRYASYRRSRLIHSGAFCLVDSAHAYFKGHGDPVEILLHMNLFAWLRLVKLVIQELFITYGREYKDLANDLVLANQALEDELARLRTYDYAAWQAENEICRDFNKKLKDPFLSDLEIGNMAGEYLFSHHVKANYSSFEEFDDLLTSGKKLF